MAINDLPPTQVPWPVVTWFHLALAIAMLLLSALAAMAGYVNRLLAGGVFSRPRFLMEIFVSVFAGCFCGAVLLYEGANPWLALILSVVISITGRDGFNLVTSGAADFARRVLPGVFPSPPAPAPPPVPEPPPEPSAALDDQPPPPLPLAKRLPDAGRNRGYE